MRKILKIDIKDKFVIKSKMYDGVKKIGDPFDITKQASETFVDEIFFSSITRSLYGYDNFNEIIDTICKNVFLPITISGGLSSLKDCYESFKLGADKICLNSILFEKFDLLNECAKVFGSQSVSVLVQAKKINNKWFAFKNMARENSNYQVKDWVRKCSENGAGEIIIVCVDGDGLSKGLDYDLLNQANNIKSPILLGGGLNSTDISNLDNMDNLEGVVFSSFFYNNFLTSK
tara:strand:+ start:2047 stop:2742 length:696 start_codon:yes stop_codon:yes gene_type:complete